MYKNVMKLIIYCVCQLKKLVEKNYLWESSVLKLGKEGSIG